LNTTLLAAANTVRATLERVPRERGSTGVQTDVLIIEDDADP
jgi:hypothetical protein